MNGEWFIGAGSSCRRSDLPCFGGEPALVAIALQRDVPAHHEQRRVRKCFFTADETGPAIGANRPIVAPGPEPSMPSGPPAASLSVAEHVFFLH